MTKIIHRDTAQFTQQRNNGPLGFFGIFRNKEGLHTIACGEEKPLANHIQAPHEPERLLNIPGFHGQAFPQCNGRGFVIQSDINNSRHCFSAPPHIAETVISAHEETDTQKSEDQQGETDD